MKNLLGKLGKNIGRKIGVSAIGLAMLLQASCSNVLEKATLDVTLSKGPYTYSIAIQNDNAGDMNNPEGSDMWINWGETGGSFELNSGQSYRIHAVGFDVNFPHEGGLEFLRYYSNEEYLVTPSPGETCEVDFTMREEPVVIGLIQP